MQHILPPCLTFKLTNATNTLMNRNIVLGGQLNELLITNKRKRQKHCNADTPPEQGRREIYSTSAVHPTTPHISSSENKR